MTGQRLLPSETARRIALSKALFREVNERINEIADGFGLAEGFLILCECASSHCQERIGLTQAEYERLRRMPTHFAVLHGHDIPAVERVVRQNDRFVTVEKFDDGGITATLLDPRRRRTGVRTGTRQLRATALRRTDMKSRLTDEKRLGAATHDETGRWGHDAGDG